MQEPSILNTMEYLQDANNGDLKLSSKNEMDENDMHNFEYPDSNDLNEVLATCGIGEHQKMMFDCREYNNLVDILSRSIENAFYFQLFSPVKSGDNTLRNAGLSDKFDIEKNKEYKFCTSTFVANRLEIGIGRLQSHILDIKSYLSENNQMNEISPHNREKKQLIELASRLRNKIRECTTNKKKLDLMFENETKAKKSSSKNSFSKKKIGSKISELEAKIDGLKYHLDKTETRTSSVQDKIDAIMLIPIVYQAEGYCLEKYVSWAKELKKMLLKISSDAKDHSEKYISMYETKRLSNKQWFNCLDELYRQKMLEDSDIYNRVSFYKILHRDSENINDPERFLRVLLFCHSMKSCTARMLSKHFSSSDHHITEICKNLKDFVNNRVTETPRVIVRLNNENTQFSIFNSYLMSRDIDIFYKIPIIELDSEIGRLHSPYNCRQKLVHLLPSALKRHVSILFNNITEITNIFSEYKDFNGNDNKLRVYNNPDLRSNILKILNHQNEQILNAFKSDKYEDYERDNRLKNIKLAKLNRVGSKRKKIIINEEYTKINSTTIVEKRQYEQYNKRRKLNYQSLPIQSSNSYEDEEDYDEDDDEEDYEDNDNTINVKGRKMIEYKRHKIVMKRLKELTEMNESLAIQIQAISDKMDGANTGRVLINENTFKETSKNGLPKKKRGRKSKKMISQKEESLEQYHHIYSRNNSSQMMNSPSNVKYVKERDFQECVNTYQNSLVNFQPTSETLVERGTIEESQLNEVTGSAFPAISEEDMKKEKERQYYKMNYANKHSNMNHSNIINQTIKNYIPPERKIVQSPVFPQFNKKIIKKEPAYDAMY